MKGNEDENPLRPFLFFNTESTDTKLVIYMCPCVWLQSEILALCAACVI